MAKPRLRLGELLVKEGIITKEQLMKAVDEQRKYGGSRIGEVLVQLGMVSEQDLIATLGKQLGISYVTSGTGLLRPAINQGLERLISKDFAIKNVVLPLSKNLNSLTCAIFDPLDLVLLDNLRKITGCEINSVIATKPDILKAIEEFYGKVDLLKEAVKESYIDTGQIDEADADLNEDELSLDTLIAKAEEAPVVKLVDLIIRQAIDERASDIHIEPYKERISLRYRIDGALYDIPPPAKHLHLPIISRIKILAKMDIAEKRLPQDGAFMVRSEKRAIDLRISTIPTVYGEKVVIRLLDRSQLPLELTQLGLEQKQLEIFRQAISSPHGMIFLTGPTGSGKTTTLYAALSEINSPHKNIITVEDPVEYRLDGISQVQIKPEIGLTFATALRSFLRQDPDIMMVGEVRDLETGRICVRSALTGHLVLSTLHTNDAPSAITRLVDIGVEPYLLMPALLLVVAQRLVRKLCPDCKEAYEPSGEKLGNTKLNADLIYRAKGCEKCNQIGYRGRVGVYEVMSINEEISHFALEGVETAKIREASIANGMNTLWENGLKKVEKGITSLEEIMAVVVEG
ncbi:MAG: Flp pilus assembly complex ATPase component TadA [Candidatus Omnitrophica bacterium]|nr:Flp pilus assembly complex ATPase component TadA [Candidatus Omnitrophota bacterium]